LVASSVERLLDTRGVAELLGLHTKTVLRLVQAGELTACRLGPKTLRFRSVDIDRFLESKARG
jgi:excisionase family DNA binding protein